MYLYATICTLTKDKDMQDSAWYTEEHYLEDEENLIRLSNEEKDSDCNCSNVCWDCLDLRRSDFI